MKLSSVFSCHISPGFNVLTILACRFVPESPRWLIQKGRAAEAERIIKQMARANKKPVPSLHNLRLEAEVSAPRDGFQDGSDQ